jgi:hypothetical protein
VASTAKQVARLFLWQPRFSDGALRGVTEYNEKVGAAEVAAQRA